MTKHTPGPWEAREHSDGSHWFVDYQQGGEGYTLVDGLSEADARLIAAAPDFLESIREVVGFFDCAIEINALQKMALLLAHFDDNLEEIKRLQTAIEE